MTEVGDLLVRRAARVFGHAADGPVAVVIRDGRVASVVPESQLAAGAAADDVPELDAAGRGVIPGFVDAHTHLVFAGSRHDEFAARLEGRRYEAGGIMRTVEATRAADDEALEKGLVRRAGRALSHGTTTIEVKSGYGLETETERRCLEAVRRANAVTPAELVPTFLGAHLNLGGDYLDVLVEEMLPVCAPLAVSCDAFCDEGALTVEESRRVLEAGARHGLVPRLHAEELVWSGGAALAAELRCASADHLVHVNEADAQALAAAGTVAVLLPATSFCLRSAYAPARMLIDAGVTVALATDCNPGTSYTTSMPFVIAVACSEYGLTIDEAVRAATEGGARALRRDDIGALRPGMAGDLALVTGEHWVDLAYHPGEDVIAATVKGGVIVHGG